MAVMQGFSTGFSTVFVDNLLLCSNVLQAFSTICAPVMPFVACAEPVCLLRAYRVIGQVCRSVRGRIALPSVVGVVNSSFIL